MIGKRHAPADQLDAAIADTETKPRIALVEFTVPLGGGRGCGIVVPSNLTPEELINVIASIASQLPEALLRVAVQAGARTIEVPGGLHVVPKA